MVELIAKPGGEVEVVDFTLRPILSPSGIAIVGASPDPTKLGFVLAQNLIQSGYGGAIHLVNPKGGRILDRTVHASVLDVPDPVDLAVVLIPPEQTPGVLTACGERGILAVIIGSGGFRETGSEGFEREAECLRIARAYGIRVVGPNCVGIINTHIPFDATFLSPPGPESGEVAFLSHSGAICAIIKDWARGQGFGFSIMASLGNQADVTEAELIEPVGADEHTRVITLYLEGIRDGRRFIEESQKVIRKKPIVALKVGRSESGRRAVASHTGALAGQEAVYDAAFNHSGIIRANTTEELFDWARALATCPLPRGPAVAILTNAGGPGVTAADAVAQNGLKLATLNDESERALKQLLPPAASIQNPVDMLASATPDQYARCLSILDADPGVDSILTIVPPPPASSAGAIARALIPVIQRSEKPILIALMGEKMIQEAAVYFQAARIPDYRFPERAIATLGALVRRAVFLNKKPSPPASLTEINRPAVENILRDAVPTSDGFMDPRDVNKILHAYGIPVAALHHAGTREEASSITESIGLPVVLKIASSQIVHKSDVGGVLADLRDVEAVEKGFDTLVKKVQTLRPEAFLTGVFVQKMIPSGQDVIVGGLQDPQFGPLVMFGSGGIEVESLGDVTFSLAPLSYSEASDCIAGTYAGRKLEGQRGNPPADRAAVVDVLLRIAQLSVDFPALQEIEINPLRVLPEGQGAWALDGRIRVEV